MRHWPLWPVSFNSLKSFDLPKLTSFTAGENSFEKTNSLNLTGFIQFIQFIRSPSIDNIHHRKWLIQIYNLTQLDQFDWLHSFHSIFLNCHPSPSDRTHSHKQINSLWIVSLIPHHQFDLPQLTNLISLINSINPINLQIQSRFNQTFSIPSSSTALIWGQRLFIPLHSIACHEEYTLNQITQSIFQTSPISPQEFTHSTTPLISLLRVFLISHHHTMLPNWRCSESEADRWRRHLQSFYPVVDLIWIWIDIPHEASTASFSVIGLPSLHKVIIEDGNANDDSSLVNISSVVMNSIELNWLMIWSSWIE